MCSWQLRGSCQLCFYLQWGSALSLTTRIDFVIIITKHRITKKSHSEASTDLFADLSFEQETRTTPKCYKKHCPGNISKPKTRNNLSKTSYCLDRHMHARTPHKTTSEHWHQTLNHRNEAMSRNKTPDKKINTFFSTGKSVTFPLYSSFFQLAICCR